MNRDGTEVEMWDIFRNILFLVPFLKVKPLGSCSLILWRTQSRQHSIFFLFCFALMGVVWFYLLLLNWKETTRDTKVFTFEQLVSQFILTVQCFQIAVIYKMMMNKIKNPALKNFIFC